MPNNTVTTKVTTCMSQSVIHSDMRLWPLIAAARWGWSLVSRLVALSVA